MWSTLSKFFGLVREEDCVDGTSTDEVAAVAEESLAVCPQREWREFDGLVTSLHSSYGLIDNEVYFTHDVMTDGVMPRVGDKVHVKASRKHHVGGWRAEFVSRVQTSSSWDNDWEEDEEEDAVEEEEGGSENNAEESKARLEKTRRLKEKRAIEKAALEELVADKMDISITKSLNFGQMEIGKTKSLKIEIKNNGSMGQTLCGWQFRSQSVSPQFELSPIRLLSIDLKRSSRKAQEALPMTLEPRQTAMVTVYCNARYLGLDQQIVVFEFEGFAIGRKIEVTVLDLIQFELQPVMPYQKSQAAGRYQQTKEAWIVPGQRPNWGHSGAKIPKRLPQYVVPEFVRKCILEQRDVTTVLPVLIKPLSSENYAARFSALLFLEEIQQEIDIREFDLDSVSMRVAGEFLALRVPGLAEGRPSLLIGDRAILSELEDSSLAPSYEGIIHEVLKDEVLLKFCEDFHNSYTSKVYNVRFVFSRTNFRRCHTAAEFASKLKNNILFPKSLEVKVSQMQSAGGSTQNAMATVVKVGPVTGIKRCPARPRAKEIYANHMFFNELLNSRQRSAVFRVLQGQGRPTPYIIFGPPGTGKTVTVVECILQIFYHLPNSCILACTPSNSAADLLAERIHQSGLVHVSDLVRVNAFQRGQENVVESVKPYCADVDDLNTIKTKRIVICTCSTAGMFYGMDLSVGHFSHVFVDEAGQATEPECMIPIGLVAGYDGQIVLAGDPLQLGPVLRSNLAKDYGLQISYLERLSHLPLYTRDAAKFVCHGAYDPLLVTKLVENYRSHPALLNLSSEIFYDGELVISADKYLVECLCNWEHLPNKSGFPVLFHGIRGEDLREGNSPSWFNPQEAIQVMKYLQSVVHNDMYRLTYDDVGIITPYRKQVEKIRLLIDRLGMEKVKVGSVEEFQGQERLVMIISTVRSTESLVSVDLRYTLGFLSNPKRFNVAITRAHALLIIIGNPHVLSQDFYWCKLLQYCVANNAYIGCDLPAIGHLKSRTNSRRFSDDAGTSSDDGEVAEQQNKRGNHARTLTHADSYGKVTDNVSESKTVMDSCVSRTGSVPDETSGALKVHSRDAPAVMLVPSTNQDSFETKAKDVCLKEKRSLLPDVCVNTSDNVFGSAVSAFTCAEISDAKEVKGDTENCTQIKDAKQNKLDETVAAGSSKAKPVNQDCIEDSSIGKHEQADRVKNEKECHLSETLLTDVSSIPQKMETCLVQEMECKVETCSSLLGFSTERQEFVETNASKNQQLKSDKELLTEPEDPSYFDKVTPALMSDRFGDCGTGLETAIPICSKDSFAVTDQVDVAGSPTIVKSDENILKFVIDGTNGALQSRDATVEQSADLVGAELQAVGTVEYGISPAQNETVRNEITDNLHEALAKDFDVAADTVHDEDIPSELEMTKCKKELEEVVCDMELSSGDFKSRDLLERERSSCQTVDELQEKDGTSAEDFQPIAFDAPASANDGITLKFSIDLSAKEEHDLDAGRSLSAVRESLQGTIPNGEPVLVFPDEDQIDSIVSQPNTKTGEELHLSVTDFTENECENIERPRFLNDYDSLKSSLEPSFAKPLPYKDSSMAESAENFENVSQYDEPSFGGRSLFDLLVLERDLESVISDMSLDVCLPDSLATTFNPSDDVCDYGKFGDRQISSPSEPYACSSKSASSVNHTEDSPAVGFSYSGSDLSKVPVLPCPVPETSEVNLVHGERVVLGKLDDFVCREETHILCRDPDCCDDVEMVSMAQLSHSCSEETIQPSYIYPEEISSKMCVEVPQQDTSSKEPKGSDSTCPPDCNVFLCGCLRKSPTGIGESKTEDTTENFGDHSKMTKTIGTTDAFEAGNDREKLLENSTTNTDNAGVPVTGSMSAPSLGVPVSHYTDSHTPAKSASQTTANDKRTEEYLPHNQMARGGGFSSQRRRGSFEREASRHSSQPFDRWGQGRGTKSSRGHFKAGLKTDEMLFSVPDSTENLCASPDREIGKFILSPDGSDNKNVVRSDRRNEEMEKCKSLAEKSSEVTAVDCKKSAVRPARRGPDESGRRRNFRDGRRPYSESQAAPVNEQEPSVDLEKKIIHQMEYYFGDFNLMRDGFLQDQIARDIDGWVDLSVIVTFNRMKALTTNFKVVCDALRKSNSGVIEINEDDTKVRRSTQKPLNTDMESWLKDLKTRAAVIKNYPSSETIDNMQSFFETFGGIAHIERGISKRSNHRGHSSSSRPNFETVDLVIFLSEEGLKNLAKRRYTTLQRMGLSASFTDELSNQCVDYFYKRRIQCIPRQSIQPVGYSGFLGDGCVQREPADGARSHFNRTRPYQSSSLRHQKFLTHENSASQHSSLGDDHHLRSSVSDGGIPVKSDDRGDGDAVFGSEVGHSVSEMALKTHVEDESGSCQRPLIGHRTTYRRTPKHQFSNRLYSEGSNADQKTFDRHTMTEPRTTRKPQSPRQGLEHSEGKRDIDKLLSNVDNMSFSRRETYSPGHQSSDSMCFSPLDSSPRVNIGISKSNMSPVSKQDEQSSKLSSPQKLDSCTQDLPSKPSSVRHSRRVKCFDPEFSFEPAPSISAVSDKHATSENAVPVASFAEADRVSQPKPGASFPQRSIPDMNLSSLTIGADDWDSATDNQPVTDALESNCSWMSENLEQNLSYSSTLDQRDDDIIIESCYEEVIEIETSDDDTKSGWE